MSLLASSSVCNVYIPNNSFFDTLEEEAEKLTGSFSVSNSFLDQVQKVKHLKKLL